MTLIMVVLTIIVVVALVVWLEEKDWPDDSDI